MLKQVIFEPQVLYRRKNFWTLRRKKNLGSTFLFAIAIADRDFGHSQGTKKKLPAQLFEPQVLYRRKNIFSLWSYSSFTNKVTGRHRQGQGQLRLGLGLVMVRVRVSYGQGQGYGQGCTLTRVGVVDVVHGRRAWMDVTSRLGYDRLVRAFCVRNDRLDVWYDACWEGG